LARTEQAAAAPAAPTPPSTTPPRVGMGHRGARPGRPLGAPPPELLSFGVVDEPAPAAAQPMAVASGNGVGPVAEEGEKAPGRGRRGRGGRAGTKAASSAPEKPTEAPAAELSGKPEAKAKRGRAAKKGGGRGRKNAPTPAKA
jgi:hypothetical protein